MLVQSHSTPIREIVIKRTIIILIDNLARGGAEVLVAGSLKALSQSYDIVLVTLTEECDFNDVSKYCLQKYSLGVRTKTSVIGGLIKLKKIIRKHQPVLIHSHLVRSTILARIACPSNIPLFFSIHNELSVNVFNQSKLYSFFEKITVNKSHTAVAVSKTVLEDYVKTIPFRGRKVVLENYISDAFFENTPPFRNPALNQKTPIKIVALGNIKASKNYEYLVKSFIYLKDISVTLDIYGNKNHPTYKTLMEIIEKYKLPVTFRGVDENMSNQLLRYHLYVMASIHEGFGLATVEAMASGLPLLLSDIPVHREITEKNAIFFDLKDPESLANQIKRTINNEYDLYALYEQGIEIAKKYRKENYNAKLLKIYQNKDYFEN